MESGLNLIDCTIWYVIDQHGNKKKRKNPDQRSEKVKKNCVAIGRENKESGSVENKTRKKGGCPKKPLKKKGASNFIKRMCSFKYYCDFLLDTLQPTGSTLRVVPHSKNKEQVNRNDDSIFDKEPKRINQSAVEAATCLESG